MILFLIILLAIVSGTARFYYIENRENKKFIKELKSFNDKTHENFNKLVMYSKQKDEYIDELIEISTKLVKEKTTKEKSTFKINLN